MIEIVEELGDDNLDLGGRVSLLSVNFTVRAGRENLGGKLGVKVVGRNGVAETLKFG